MQRKRLSTILRLAAVLVLVGALGAWVATGAHRGWTQTRITEMQHDEITGIDYPVHHDGFVAGLDFLIAAGGVAAVLASFSLLTGRRRAG